MSFRKRYSFEREDEVKDGLEDFIKELLEESSPLLPDDAIRKLARERASRAYEFVSDQLEEFQKEKEENAATCETALEEIAQQKKEIRELTEMLEKTKNDLSETEELLRISAPGTYHGRRYGV